MNSRSDISRRDFLKLGAAGLSGLFSLGFKLDMAESAGTRQGRVTYNSVTLYAAPTRSSRKIGGFRRDTVLEINEQVTGGQLEDYNRSWYRIGQQGYVYSGGIQPVETHLNDIVMDLPEAGTVGEITVPFSESWWSINRSPFPGARLYYATTHWIKDVTVDKRDGSLWYRAFDHLYSAYYYIRPYNVRILPAIELAPLSPDVPPEEKYIEVRLDEQTVLAYEGERRVFQARASTGTNEFSTPTGWFKTFHKRPTAHMVGGESEYAAYDLSGVPWDCYITENGVAIHGTFWHNDYGAPHSHGCINLSPQSARWLYHWTLPPVPPGEYYIFEPGHGTALQVIEFTPQRRKYESRILVV